MEFTIERRLREVLSSQARTGSIQDVQFAEASATPLPVNYVDSSQLVSAEPHSPHLNQPHGHIVNISRPNTVPFPAAPPPPRVVIEEEPPRIQFAPLPTPNETAKEPNQPRNEATPGTGNAEGERESSYKRMLEMLTRKTPQALYEVSSSSDSDEDKLVTGFGVRLKSSAPTVRVASPSALSSAKASPKSAMSRVSAEPSERVGREPEVSDKKGSDSDSDFFN